MLELHLAVPANESEDLDRTICWLSDTFLPKFLKWAIHDKGSKPTIAPLSHVCVKKYCFLYHILKVKYAESLIEVSLK